MTNVEIDELTIALRSAEPILVARMDRICRDVLQRFKSGKLTQGEISELKADWDAAKRLLNVMTEQAGGNV